MIFLPRYSKKASSSFWKAIDAIPKDKHRRRIRKLAVELDDLESEVLDALAVHGAQNKTEGNARPKLPRARVLFKKARPGSPLERFART